MKSDCPECGAPISRENNCSDRFYRFLALEMDDPEYSAVHHLTVAAYMLQHPSRLSLRGWQAMRQLLSLALDQGLNPETLRARIQTKVDSRSRSWSLVKGPQLELPEGFSWSLTILSVDDSVPAQYRLDIERWARQALADTRRILLED